MNRPLALVALFLFTSATAGDLEKSLNTAVDHLSKKPSSLQPCAECGATIPAKEPNTCTWKWERRKIHVSTAQLSTSTFPHSLITPQTSVGDVQRWNKTLFEAAKNIRDWNKKHSGDENTLIVRLPGSRVHAVKTGDTLAAIATRYGAIEKQLVQLNRALLKDLRTLDGAKATADGNPLSLTPVSVSLLSVSLQNCPEERAGFYKFSQNGKTRVHADINLIIDPKRRLSQLTQPKQATEIEKHLHDAYRTSEAEFEFSVKPFVVDESWTEADLRWLFRSTAIATGPGPDSRKTHTYSLRELQSSHGGAHETQGVTTDEIVYRADKDPKVIAHEVGHAFLAFYRMKANVPGEFDHKLKGILSNPVEDLNSENVRYILEGLPEFR